MIIIEEFLNIKNDLFAQLKDAKIKDQKSLNEFIRDFYLEFFDDDYKVRLGLTRSENYLLSEAISLIQSVDKENTRFYKYISKTQDPKGSKWLMGTIGLFLGISITLFIINWIVALSIILLVILSIILWFVKTKKTNREVSVSISYDGIIMEIEKTMNLLDNYMKVVSAQLDNNLCEQDK